MMIRRANDRGRADFGWLQSRHSFSFGQYFDPQHMGYGPLRVINEDSVSGGAGFPPHGHADMEIISYVVSGALEHRDSEGNRSIIRPGEVQKMSAGKGIMHSEYNASKTDDVHFLQIWIMPDKKGIAPGYQQKAFQSLTEPSDDLALLVSPSGEQGSISIEQQVRVYGGKLLDDAHIAYQLAPQNIAWLQVVKGTLQLNGESISTGDGIAIDAGERMVLSAPRDAEVLLFDMVN